MVKLLDSFNKKLWGLLFIFVLFIHPSQGKILHQQDVHQQVEAKLFQFHLDETLDLLPKVENQGLAAFYRFQVYFYKYLTAQSKADLTSLRSNWETTLEVINELPADNSLRDILLSDVYAKKGMVEFLDKNYLKGAWDFKLSRSNLRKYQRANPGDPNSLKMEGLFNCLFGIIPKKYHWITQTLGFKGNVKRGIQQLEEAAEEGEILSTEAWLLHYFATKNLLNRPFVALERLEKLRSQHPSSILLDYCQVTGYMGVKQNEKALDILRKREEFLSHPEVFYIPLWDYHLARAYYYRAEYQQAQKMFATFAQQHKGDLYQTDAKFRLGMSFLLSGDYPSGKKHFHELASFEASDLEEDEYAHFVAKSFLKTKPSPNTLSLFKSRNAYDGGYYEKALSYLNPLSEQAIRLSPEELTFLYYLYGRIYHTQGKLSLAYDNYLKCIAQPDQHSVRWHQSYSCYYIGEIAKSQKNIELARSYYKKALSFDDYFYQSSLENQCKVALGEL